MAEITPREIIGKPSTPRVEKLQNKLYTSKLQADSERCRLYTEYMKEHWRDPPNTRQGGALKYVLSNLTPVINEDELVVGQISRYFRGTQLYPEYEAWVLEEFRGIIRPEEKYAKGAVWKVEAEKEDRKIGIFNVNLKEADIIKEAAEFWEGKDLRSIAEKFFLPKDLVETFKSWLAHGLQAPPGVMWDVPEGRVIVDYKKVLKKGLKSVIGECKQKMSEIGIASAPEELHKWDFYKGVILACEGAVRFAEKYGEEAGRLAKECVDKKRKKELLEIARICRKVPRESAETFQEAIQSFWFVHTVLFIELNGRGISPGRFDQYMYPFYKKDIEEGRITNEEVLELLELLRIKFTQITRCHPTAVEGTLGGSIYQNMTLGGVDKDGNPVDNELSKLILRAGINIKTHQPTLSVRWNDKLSHDFKMEAINCIKAGSGYPAIFCDKPAIERFQKVTKASIEDARDWGPCGCVDMQICECRAPMHAINHFNNPKILEIVLNKGIDPITGDKLFDVKIDPDSASLEDIKKEYFRILRILVEKLAKIENIRMLVHNEVTGLMLPFASALLNDCIEKGMHCQEGGCRYNDAPYFISCGMINVVNSLASLKKNVFEEKNFTIEELRQALKDNFKAHERIKKLCSDAPKFGNDDSYVDKFATELYDAWSEITQSQKNWMGEPYRPSTLSVVTQVTLGKAVGALPDGREAFSPLADGAISAFPGTDGHGPTANLKSACKVHTTNLQATLLNLKFHPTAVWGKENAERLIAFNDAYDELGGYHVQYNVVDSKMLKDAQVHPENHQDLMVRVAGFTARFVELGKDAQDEIIKRTEHMEV
jgi:formate C-acetyltransferase/4-hydroxyphenylacetate decarboxylase large subunit